jgi:uncharacterized protein HemY
VAASATQIDAAIDLLKAEGYVVLRERSYQRARERQRVAEALRDAAERDAERAHVWARNCLNDERRLRDRCTFLYGVARAHGATEDELRGSA